MKIKKQIILHPANIVYSKLIFLLALVLLMLNPFNLSSQNAIKWFIDSLQTQKKDSFETSIGKTFEAAQVYKKIDTTINSRQQIDYIITYYNYNLYDFKDYPYPLLIWAYKTAKSLNYEEGVIQSLIKLGDLKRLEITSNNDYFNHYKTALNLYKKSNNQEGVGDMHRKIGLSHMSIREYDKSIKKIFEALDIYKKEANTKKIAIAYHCLGDVYRHLKDTINAIKYIKLSAKLEQNYPQANIRVMNTGFLGELYLQQNKLEKAKRLLIQSNNTINTTKVLPYMYLYNYKNLGEIEEENGNLSKAFYYFKKAFSIAYVKKQNIHQQLLFSTHLASVLIKQKKINEALYLLEHIEDKTKHKNSKSNSFSYRNYTEFYQKMALIHELNKNYKKANHYYKKSIESNNKHNALEMIKNGNELEKKYQSKIDSQAIQLLKNENQLKQRQYTIAVIIMVALSGMLVILYFYFSQRSKAQNRKEELAKLAIAAEQLKAEKLINDKQIILLELQLKQRELTSNSISLLQKNKQLENITNTLEDIKPIVNKNTLRILNTTISNYKAQKTTYNWKDFKLTFEGVNPNFYNNILSKHPNLSNNEKKLCAFLKLGLNSKEISAITQQSNRTIVIARSRLRKKLELNKGDNLTSYILKF